MKAVAADAPWYADGLRFGCTRCGVCCTGGGIVEVTDAEIARLAGYLGLEDAVFRAKFTRPLRRGRIKLTAHDQGACVFLDASDKRRGCQVHAARPAQCRSYPFWASIVETQVHWQDEATRCPGINRGAHHPLDDIRAGLRAEADPDGQLD
jgi:Fe-S-cluster containining protein